MISTVIALDIALAIALCIALCRAGRLLQGALQSAQKLRVPSVGARHESHFALRARFSYCGITLNCDY